MSLLNKIKNIINRSNWWVWVQFIFLCLSILANLFLWVRNENLKERVHYADYNDRAWEAYDEFKIEISKLEKEFREEIPKLFIRTPWHEKTMYSLNYENIDNFMFTDNEYLNREELFLKDTTSCKEMLNRFDRYDQEWLKIYEPQITMAKSKLYAYENAAQDSLPAVSRFKKLLSTLSPPSGIALIVIERESNYYISEANEPRPSMGSTFEDSFDGDGTSSFDTRQNLIHKRQRLGALANELIFLMHKLKIRKKSIVDNL